MNMDEHKLRILYIAYSCNPYNGSEDKIGWNVPLESTARNKVFVLTKEEHRKTITRYLENNPNDNISFYYVDIPNVYKKLFKGFLYSGRLLVWHKRAVKTAKKICTEKNIDIIHQITPVEFRAIGHYWKIDDCKFVVGPIGGAGGMPKALFRYTQRKASVETLRKLINYLCKLQYKLNGKLRKCDYIIYANEETRDYLEG